MKIFNLIAALLLLTVLAAPVNAAITVNAEYETGLENDGDANIGVVEAYSDRIEASENYARVGDWSLRTELRYGDETSVGCRAECNVRYTGTPAEEPVVERGVNKFYGFSILLDPGEGNYDWDINGDILMQSKQTDSGPHFHFMTDEGKFKYVYSNVDTDPAIDTYFGGDYTKGIWYDFVLDHKPAYSGGNGHLKFYFKKATDSVYTKVLDYSGNTLLWDKGGYTKWGVYKSTWCTTTTDSDLRIVYHDNVRVATTFADADPDPNETSIAQELVEDFGTASDQRIDNNGDDNEVTRVSADTGYRWGAYNAGGSDDIHFDNESNDRIRFRLNANTNGSYAYTVFDPNGGQPPTSPNTVEPITIIFAGSASGLEGTYVRLMVRKAADSTWYRSDSVAAAESVSVDVGDVQWTALTSASNTNLNALADGDEAAVSTTGGSGSFSSMVGGAIDGAGFYIQTGTGNYFGIDMLKILYSSGGDPPPAAPTNLEATAGDEQVSLDWDDNTEPDFDSYTVYRDTNSGAPYDWIASVGVSNYLDTGVTNDITYYYVVTALDVNSNESADSSEASATPSAPDTYPPTPNPATFSVVPAAISSSAISMTATTGSDATTPVEYYFDETSLNPGGTDSGWQTSASYTDSGLTASTQYTYTVQMRDSVSPTPNTGTASSPANATTDASDTSPPTPNPATWLSVPSADSSSAISMTATTGSDASGPVEYYFDETSGNPGGTDSSWQTNSSYTDSGLDPDTQYTYTVQMRDNVPNTGTASSPANATTDVVAESKLQYSNSGGDKMDVKDGQKGAQSWKHGTSGTFTVTKIVLHLSRDSDTPNGDLRVDIGTSVNGGTVSGSSFDIPQSSITNTSSGSSFMTYSHTYSTPVSGLSQGTTYYLNLDNLAGNGKADYVEYGNNTYSDGTYYKDGDNDGKDMWFEIWGTIQ